MLDRLLLRPNPLILVPLEVQTIATFHLLAFVMFVSE
jgi:hypothetical protein